MKPSWTVYGQVSDDIRDEEALNNCLADLIDDTLTHNPDFLNHLFDGVVEFGGEPDVVGTQNEPLPFRDEGIDREIDLVIANESKIVGIESKRRDSLSRNQLNDEVEKLECNAEGRDVILVAVTEDIRKPSLIESYSDTVQWTSWFQIAQQVYSAESLDEEWQPTVSRTKKMFREFGYEGFDGIDKDEFRITVWELWKQVASQTEGLDTGERWPYENIKTVQGTSKGWKPIDRDWMLLTFSGNASGDHTETCYALLSNKRTQEIRIGLSVRPWQNESLQEFMQNNAERLADRILEKDMEVVQFPLNWLVGRKNLPKGHRKARTAEYPSSREELVDAFSDRQGMEGDGANRFVLGYRIDISNALEESVDCMTQLQSLFGTDTGPELDAILHPSEESNDVAP